jgi:hypothetical protein
MFSSSPLAGTAFLRSDARPPDWSCDDEWVGRADALTGNALVDPASAIEGVLVCSGARPSPAEIPDAGIDVQ